MKIKKPIVFKDFYKTGHIYQYPEGTTLVKSNLTARSARLASNVSEDYDNKVVFFGLQGFIKRYLIDTYNEGFFNRPKSEVVAEYKRRMDTSLGPNSVGTEHIEALHDLGYLPIKIDALPEGSRVNLRVPMLTIENTLDEFYWLTNDLETALSAELWKPCTTATVAYEYRRVLEKWAIKTGAPLDFVDFQGHDFSFRGLSGLDDAYASAPGHLLSFVGTDTIPAIDYLEDYYNANAENELIGTSVPATEHSVMCMGGLETEIDTFRRLITKVYPEGIVSIVSDTWDFWKVITEFTVELKEEILSRKENALGLAKVVFRPDSGDPVEIVCGKEDCENPQTPEEKGAVQCLWEIFGGDVNEKGYKVLHPRVGLIYGDSITLKRAGEILRRLEKKGFAANNIVFGIGSYTYQYCTRDTFGFAVKSTYGEINHKPQVIFKNPKTDNGVKKSAVGLLRVEKEGNDFVLYDNQEPSAGSGELKTVFMNGKLLVEHSLSEIRARVRS